MYKMMITLLCIFTLLGSPAMSETTSDWFNKAQALSDGEKFSDPQKAIEYLNNAIRLQPNDAEAYYNRGIAYDNLGRHQQAIKDYSQTVRLKPDYAEAFHNRGTLYNTTGQYQLAIADFNESIRINPGEADNYIGLGFAYDQLGQHQQAITEYSKAIALKPDNARAYNNRGLIICHWETINTVVSTQKRPANWEIANYIK